MDYQSDSIKPDQGGAEETGRVSKADRLDRLIDPRRLDRSEPKEAERKPRPEKPNVKRKNLWKKAWFRKLAVFLAIVIAASGGYGLYVKVKADREKEALFNVVPSMGQATVGGLTLSIPASGSLAGSGVRAVTAAGAGEIVSLLVRSGDAVSEGDPLAILDTTAIQDQIDALYDQIDTLYESIDSARTTTDSFYVKAAADGTLKRVVVEKDDMVEDAMAESGYLALISTEDKMLVAEFTGTVSSGQSVVVKTQGYTYTGAVEDVDGTLTVSIPTDARTIGAAATVYDSNGGTLGAGVLALASWEPVVSVRGKVTKIYYGENDEVEKGDTLFNTVAYSQALISSYEQIEDRREQIAELTELLDDTELTAPCGGVVTSVSKSEGDAVAEGETIVIITLTDTWVLDVSVDELDINEIEVGQPADIVLDSLPNNTYEGQVTDISNSSTSSGGITSYVVRITLTGDASFKLGMNASAEIIVEEAENALRIPVDAVRTLGNTHYVVVYTERTQEELEAIRQSILKGDAATMQSALASAGDGSGRQTDAQSLLDNILALNGSIADRLYGRAVQVEVGIENESYAQILSGLSQGDIVILPQEDNSEEESDSGFFGMGMFGAGTGGLTGGDTGGRTMPDGGSMPDRPSNDGSGTGPQSGFQGGGGQ